MPDGMMDVEEMAFLATFLKPGNQVLEIEHISEYLQQQSYKALSVLGS